MSSSPLQNKLPRQTGAFSTTSTSWHDVAKTRAFQPGYGIIPAQRNFTAMLNFVETPLAWETSEAEKIAEGHHPIIRYFSKLNRFLDPEKSTKNALFIAGTTLGVVLVLMVVGFTNLIKAPTEKISDNQTLLAASMPEENFDESEESPKANALFAVANGLEASPSKSKSAPPAFRSDPFKPLIELEWLKALLDKQNADKEKASPITKPTTTQTVNPFPSKPAEPTLGVPVESLIQFVGVVSNEDPRKPATVLLKLLNEANSMMLSKRIGSSFEYGGNYFTLTAVKGAYLYLTINGFKNRIELSSTSPSSQTTGSGNRNVSTNSNQTPLPNSNNEDSNIEKLLNDLGKV
ncbi:MAG: hypothetical protein LW809_02930 [Vampirovibrionales bacterium]|jgi:hypothetical protein|nr:hypothetical protein [Vampirovibrionales bacterium]